jgi:hypothetical protein
LKDTSKVIELYLNLQDVITIETLVMHFMICIIRITATLIFHKREPTLSVNDIRVDFKTAKDPLTDDWQLFGVLGYRNGQGGRSC